MDNRTSPLYLGVMTGTSVDAIDLALVDFSAGAKLIASAEYEFPEDLQSQIRKLYQTELITVQGQLYEYDPQKELGKAGQLEHQLGIMYADAINRFILEYNLDKKSISAIGLHGQTICHSVDSDNPFSWQAGDANLVAALTGLTTVADFRRMDIALGGQGAPLAPAFHAALLSSKKENRLVLNLGGIANLTFLPRNNPHAVSGFDTGPANCLLDANYRRYHPQDRTGYDRDAEFAASGKVNSVLLKKLLDDPFFTKPAPKSTGTEKFNLNWVQRQLDCCDFPMSGEDIQATLLELTVETITRAIEENSLSADSIFLCGGGQHNPLLVRKLENRLSKSVILTSDEGIDGDAMEAMLMAWLAKMRIEEKPASLPSVTGARRAAVLGAVYHPGLLQE